MRHFVQNNSFVADSQVDTLLTYPKPGTAADFQFWLRTPQLWGCILYLGFLDVFRHSLDECWRPLPSVRSRRSQFWRRLLSFCIMSMAVVGS